MKRAAPMLLAVALAAGAHAQVPPPARVAAHADSIRSTPAGPASMDSSEDIVLAVSNPIDPPRAHAGSSLIGYIPAGNYGAGERAISTLETLQKAYGWRQLTGWPIKALRLYCIVVQPPRGVSRSTMLAALSKDARVQLAEPLQTFSVYARRGPELRRENNPYVGLERQIVDTDAARAHAFSTGKGVDIAVVDTGVDVSHPDLKARIRDVHDFVDDNPAAFDRDAHGTEVAGIIAGDGIDHGGVVGVAPQATLSVFKACWYATGPATGARCNSFTLAKALAAVLDSDARVVNLSLGGPPDALLSRLLGRVLAARRIVVAALPPDGQMDGFPDDVPGVLVVRSSGASTAPAGVLSAPGLDILTTQPDGRYDFTSGSSMATACVSGIAALLLAASPDLDAAQIHALLLRNSRITHGVLQVNAAAAMAALRKDERARLD